MSHKGQWIWALAGGLAAGLSAGLLMGTKKGEKLTEEAKKEVQQLTKEVMKRVEKVEDFTKVEYEAIVDELVSHYKRAKDLAEDEVADLKAFFMGQWEAIQEMVSK